jgi:integrase
MITIRAVAGLAPGEMIWDSGREAVKGFGCRRQHERASYFVKYRIAGRQRFITIGQHGAPWTPETARREAKKILGRAASGRDPVPSRADTLGRLAADYLVDAAKRLRPRSLAEVQRHLTLHWAPMSATPINALTRRQISERVAEIAEASGPTAANRARSALSACLTWAIRQGHELVANPVAGTNRPAEGPSRDRVLADGELAAIWRACRDDDYGRIVRLLALTGQRRNEVGGMRSEEVDAETGLWVIPAARTKNRRAHAVPLAPQALTLLPGPNGREWVFGVGQGGFSGWSAAKVALDARAGLTTPFRLHDLRRTCATGLANLGVLPHVIEAVLNHISGSRASVAGIYNRATYAKEMRTALEQWASHVEAITK